MALPSPHSTSPLSFRLWKLSQRAEQELMAAARDGRLTGALQEALGVDASNAACKNLVDSWSASPSSASLRSLPPIQLVSEAVLPTSRAAYVGELQQILVNRSWFAAASDEQILLVLLEEVGHYYDSQLNPSDTPGDEGQRFAEVLLGVSRPGGFNPAAFEDDNIVVVLNGVAYQAEASTFVGTPNPDSLLGANGVADSLSGLGGNDTLDGGLGDVSDTMNGGSGNDRYLADFLDVVQETSTLSSEIDTIRFRPASKVDNPLPAYTLAANVENIEVVAGGGRAYLVGNGLANRITGSTGDDVLRTDSTLTFNGNKLASPRDTLIGGLGNDEYQVINSNSMITELAGQGNDVVFYLSPFYAVANGAPISTFLLPNNVEDARLDPASTDAIALTGNAGNNQLFGNKGSNSLRGGDGNDVLVGGPDGTLPDYFDGGIGSNTIVYVDGFVREPVVLDPPVETFALAAPLTTARSSPADSSTQFPSTDLDSSRSTRGRRSRHSNADTASFAGTQLFSAVPAGTPIQKSYSETPPVSEIDRIVNFDENDVIALDFMPDGFLPKLYKTATSGDYGQTLPLGQGYNLVFNSLSGTLVSYENDQFPYGSEENPARFIAIISGTKNTELTESNFSFVGTTKLIGSAGSPNIIEPTNKFGEVTEDATVFPGELVVRGPITFRDFDVSDVHVATVRALDANPIGGIMTLSPIREKATTTDGSLSWAYRVSNSSTQYLRAGQTVTELFIVTISDARGGKVEQLITIRVHGVNDAPTALADSLESPLLVTDYCLSFTDPAASGNVLANDTDIDLGDSKSVLNPDIYVGIYGSLTLAEDGSWTYLLDVHDEDVIALADGETAEDVFSYTMADGSGATSSSTLTIAITGGGGICCPPLAIVNRDLISSEGFYGVDVPTAEVLQGCCGDDTILGSAEGVVIGINLAGAIATAEGEDRVTGAGSTWGILLAEGASIATGPGNDSVDALTGGFGGQGAVDLGTGSDVLKGFGSGSFQGGPGSLDTDTLLFGEGTYWITEIATDTFEIRQDPESTTVMNVSGFEKIGAAFGADPPQDLFAGIVVIDASGNLSYPS